MKKPRRWPVPRQMPQSGHPLFRAGTERVESAWCRSFPGADQADGLGHVERKEDYRRILGDVRTGKIDILVGTQTQDCISQCDAGGHRACRPGPAYPRFSRERADVSIVDSSGGRAGRGDVEGEVVVQAFTPFHRPSSTRAATISTVLRAEMEFRQQLKYPPSRASPAAAAGPERGKG